MIYREKNGIQWLEFELLVNIPHLAHGVFLRSGGVSKPPFNSLNVGMGSKGSVVDYPASVKANRDLICQILSIERCIHVNQVHGVNLVHHLDVIEQMPDADGLITQVCDRGLMIKHADCQAAIFYDTEHHGLAVVHAGWRGNVQNIYAKTIEHMHQAFGTMPQQLLVCISPSLGPVHAEFKNYQQEFPSQFWQFQVAPFHFDLWAVARMQLEHCGVLPQHIEIASICTYAHSEGFFSYRRDRITGRNATIAALRARTQ